jgi:outer membrane lipoprotein carrier protein
MGIRRFLPLAAIVVAVVACDRGGSDDEAANRPVAIWSPDSAVAPGAPVQADSGLALGNLDAATTSAGGATTSPSTGGAAPVGPGGGSGAGDGGSAAPAPDPAGPSADADDPATSVLLRAERAYESVRTLQADFVQDLTVPLLESTQRSRGEIFHRKPDLFLMRFSDPAGDVVVADGRHLWLYYPSSDPKQVVRTSMGQAGRLDLQREFLSNPTERFVATLDGAESVAGRPARALTLIPRGQSPYRKVRIWIDDQDALARRFEITENNEAVRVVELRNLRVNVLLEETLFTFVPPAGAEIFDQ